MKVNVSRNGLLRERPHLQPGNRVASLREGGTSSNTSLRGCRMLRSNWNNQQSSLFWRELECSGRRISRTSKADGDSREAESPTVQSSPPVSLSIAPDSPLNVDPELGA